MRVTDPPSTCTMVDVLEEIEICEKPATIYISLCIYVVPVCGTSNVDVYLLHLIKPLLMMVCCWTQNIHSHQIQQCQLLSKSGYIFPVVYSPILYCQHYLVVSLSLWSM